MTISDLGSIGEFVSSIAVVFSLVYVAIQVRENSRDEDGFKTESHRGVS